MMKDRKELSINIDDIMDKITPTNFEDEDDLIETEIEIHPEVKLALEQIAEKKNCTVEEVINGILKYFVENEEEMFQVVKENRKDKCEKGILGKPLFDYEDEVGFYLTPFGEEKEIFCIGKVYIIDRYGTFEQNEEPSYDIMVDNFNNSGEQMLVKHVRESECYNIRNK